MTHWLTDRNDPRVQAAIAKKCGICPAKPGQDCHHGGHPLLRGIIHEARVPQKLIDQEAS